MKWGMGIQERHCELPGGREGSGPGLLQNRPPGQTKERPGALLAAFSMSAMATSSKL